MSNLFTKISEAARRQQEQLERARSSPQNSPPVQPVEPSSQDQPPSLQHEHKSQTNSPSINRPTKNQTKSKTAKQKPNGRTVNPNGSTERSKHSTQEQNENTILPTSISLDSLPDSVMEEMAEGANPNAKRTTERYSFEIYSDQKHLIRKLQVTYEFRTGKHLPKSRIIREALDAYLNLALQKTS